MSWYKKEIVIFCFLLLLGAVLRLVALDKYPVGLHGDEAITGIEARRILQNGFIGIWSPGALGQVALIFYWTAFLLKLFGGGIFVIRFSLAVLNILWIPFFYLTVRSLFSKKTAIISTLLLITAYAPLSFSRRADLVAANFALFPSIYFYIKALKTSNKWYFLLAGFFIGLNHYLYASFWITPIVFLLYMAYEMLRHKKILFVKARYIFMLFSAYLLTSLPVLYFAFTHQGSFFSRSKMISIFSSQSYPIYQQHYSDIIGLLTHNIATTLSMFNLSYDPDLQNIFTRRPALDFFSGILFLFGFFYGIRYIKKPQYFLIYLFFSAFLLGTIFTVDAPNYRRSQESIYFAYIFAALGITYFYNLLRIKVHKHIILPVLSLLIYCICLYNIVSYFAQAASSEAKYIMCYQLTEISSFIKAHPSIKYVYFYSSRWSYHYETLQYLLYNTPGEDRSKEFGIYSLINNYKNAAYIFLPEYTTSLEGVLRNYPNGQTFIRKGDDGSTLFTAYIPR